MLAIQNLVQQTHALYNGGNYTGVHFKKVLEDISVNEAITKVETFNTIHTLVFYTHYYMDAVCAVLNGNPLQAKDSLSFVHDPIHTEEEWKVVVSDMFSAVENFKKKYSKS